MTKRDLVTIRKQIIAAQEEAQIDREREVAYAREIARAELLVHKLAIASKATKDGAASAYADFITMAYKMRAGGFHRVRLSGGRGLDG
jgi:hypothetical protein